ncbi:(2Fe-2S)-binding protein, partial [Kitasatospora sp. NPDC059327]
AQDFRVWRRREYLQHPKINGDDSPFGAYRLWTRQFYPPKDPA